MTIRIKIKKLHRTDIATSDFVPNKGLPFFFSRPEAGLTTRFTSGIPLPKYPCRKDLYLEIRWHQCNDGRGKGRVHWHIASVPMEELENIPSKQLGALLVVDARCTYSIWVTRHHHHLYLESLHPWELGALLEVDATRVHPTDIGR